MWVLLLLALSGCAKMTYHPPDLIHAKEVPVVVPSVDSTVPVGKTGGS